MDCGISTRKSFNIKGLIRNILYFLKCITVCNPLKYYDNCHIAAVQIDPPCLLGYETLIIKDIVLKLLVGQTRPLASVYKKDKNNLMFAVDFYFYFRPVRKELFQPMADFSDVLVVRYAGRRQHKLFVWSGIGPAITHGLTD